MAKNKKAASSSAAPQWLTCSGYELTVTNGPGVNLRLDVTDENGDPYFLKVRLADDRKDLVRQLLGLIAARWPEFDWEFQADDKGSIIAVR